MFYLIQGLTAITLAILRVLPRIVEVIKLNLGVSLEIDEVSQNLNQIAFNVFDFITSLYTYCRLTIEPYYPFKPRLQIYTICYYFDYVKKPSAATGSLQPQGWLMANDPIILRDRIVEASKHLGEIKPIALSIVYRFSDWDWNEKYIKLIDLRCSTSNEVIDSISKLMVQGQGRGLEHGMPDYNPLNHDYNVSIETSESDPDLFKEDDKAIVTSNLEAYLRRASTWEAEQTLRLLSERPDLMEFLYELPEEDANIVSKFHRGLFGFVASDELGTEFNIRVNTP